MPGRALFENWFKKPTHHQHIDSSRFILISFSNSPTPGCCFGTLSCRRIATRDVRGEPRGEWRGEWRGEPLPTRLRAPEATFDVMWCEMMWPDGNSCEKNLQIWCWDIEKQKQAVWHWKILDAALISHFNVAQMNLGACLSWSLYGRQTNHSFSAHLWNGGIHGFGSGPVAGSYPLDCGDPALVNIGSDQHRETWANKSLSQGLLRHKPAAIITLQRLTVDTSWLSQRFVPKACGWKSTQRRHQKLFDRTAECLIHRVMASASSPRPEFKQRKLKNKKQQEIL